MKILITSGGTSVPIDDVRRITNMSSGKYGANLALNFTEMQHDVILFHSKGSETNRILYIDTNNQVLPYPKSIEYNTFDDYLKVKDVIQTEKPAIIISAAAVSDYIMDKTDGKISSSEDELIIRLKKAPKVLPTFKQLSSKSMVVGFKLLVSPSYQEVEKAVQKVLYSGADYVVYNDLSEIRKGNTTRLLFDNDMNYVEAKDAKSLAEHIEEKWLNREGII